MIRPVQVTALSGYKIHVIYANGVKGAIDLSDVAGRGIFTPLKDKSFFKRVYIGDHGQIAWPDEIEICPDAAYWELNGKVFNHAKRS